MKLRQKKKKCLFDASCFPHISTSLLLNTWFLFTLRTLQQLHGATAVSSTLPAASTAETGPQLHVHTPGRSISENAALTVFHLLVHWLDYSSTHTDSPTPKHLQGSYITHFFNDTYHIPSTQHQFHSSIYQILHLHTLSQRQTDPKLRLVTLVCAITMAGL